MPYPVARMVPSGAGGLAEACDVGRCCEQEAYCCCDKCGLRLCGQHWGPSRCPHTDVHVSLKQHPPPLPPPPLEDLDFPPLPPPGGQQRRRLTGKQTVQNTLVKPEIKLEAEVDSEIRLPDLSSPGQYKKGGWRKCEHPQCESPSMTLLRLTGRKVGFKHLLDPTIACCGQCRRRPLLPLQRRESSEALGEPTSEAIVAVSTPVKRKFQDMNRLQESDLQAWDDDSAEALVDEYTYTVASPMKFALERWHMLYRIGKLVVGGKLKSATEAEVVFKPLRVPRKHIGKMVNQLKASDDHVALVNSIPADRQIGRHKHGALKYEQKMDLVTWVRLRESQNVPVTRDDVLAAMSEFIKANTGDVHAAASLNMYIDWREWVRKKVSDPGLHISSSKRARALRQIEANSLTKEATLAEYDRLQAILRRRNIAHFDVEEGRLVIDHPELLWACDEKGFNDERMSGQAVLHTSAVSNVSAQHSKSLRHVSVLSFVSAAGGRSTPAVVVAGKQWHRDWEKIWPGAVIAASPRGSFTGPLFVQLMAESFVHYVRVELGIKGMEEGSEQHQQCTPLAWPVLEKEAKAKAKAGLGGWSGSRPRPVPAGRATGCSVGGGLGFWAGLLPRQILFANRCF